MRQALASELLTSLQREQFDITSDGVFFPRQGIVAQGEYAHRVNGGEWTVDSNLVTTEGLTHLLNVALGATAKPAGYYLALYSGAISPAANWTAASFAATANEIVSMTEGYTSSTRPAWTPSAASAGTIDNMSAAASLTIATATVLNVNGAALLTNSVRGGTLGVLVSASRYAATRTFQAGDIYEVGYRLALTS